MKRYTTLLILTLFVGVMVLSACSTNSAQPTSEVNLPLISGSATGTLQPEGTAAAESTPVQEGAAGEMYPAGGEATLVAGSTAPDTTYPYTTSLPQTDAEWEAFITTKLDGHHTLEFLLSKDYTAEQWRQVLSEPQHADVSLTEEELNAMIAWLMAH